MISTRVIVVGAGAAGVAATARLLENGIKDVIVLEAENRIGGRVYTTKLGDGVVDLGAQWVHGETDNIVSELAQPLGLLGETLTEVTDTKFFTSSGEQLSSKTTEKYLAPLMVILASSEDSLKQYKGSLGEYLTKEYRQYLSEKKVESKSDLALAKYFLDWFAKFENSIDGSDSWFYTSGPGHTHYRDCEGNLLQAWKSGGYHTILDVIMKKFPDPSQALPVESKVQFNKVVSNIKWDHVAGGMVQARCTDGTSYAADYVIVTASLGVLKEQAASLFTPPLPDRKLKSIEGLSIGTVDKLYLRFPHQWWEEGTLGFSLLWTEEDEQQFNRDNQTESGRHWLTDVFGFYEVDHNPNVLCGWVIGPSARVMEQLPLAEVTAGCMELLTRFLGRSHTIPAPLEVLRTTWSLNPHFRGSYSFRSMDSDALDTYAKNLAEPVVNSSGKETLLFAGEASHEHFFSTVHGAIETGWREADRVINMISSDVGFKKALTAKCQCQVVIVGAGIAGLAAARKLLECGVSDVVLLEAQERPGGRILTLPLNDGWVEAGAQWIHGQNNPVWTLANEHQLLSEHTSVEGEGPYLREDGVEFDRDLVLQVAQVVENIIEDCDEFCEEGFCADDIPCSFGEHLKQSFDEYLNSCTADSPEQRRMKEELFDWHIRFQIIDNSSTALENLSAKAWGKYLYCEGTDCINFTQGYSTLIEKITDALPPGMLRLATPVTKISWRRSVANAKSVNGTDSGRHGGVETWGGDAFCPVVVECGDGSSVAAQHCIVTCSLGYLKEHHRRLFEPSLPKQITQAIQDLGFATINKIYLDFGTPWWDSGTKGFQLIWSKEERDSAYEQRLPAWTRCLTGFDVLPNHEAVLLGWIGGGGAEVVEVVSEEEVGRRCTQLLRQFTGRSDIPEPGRVLRTQWRKNVYVRGGYGNTTVACDVSNTGPETLAEPVYADVTDPPFKLQHPVLLLAGEATHETHFSTTHGAFLSGERQAQIIAQYMQTISAGD